MKTLGLIAGVLMACVVIGLAESEKAEPARLTSLRDSWNSAKVRDSRPIRQGYLEALLQLKDTLTRAEKLADAILVQDEITALTEKAGMEVVIPEAKGDLGGVELTKLRGTYERAMAVMIRKNDGIYERALEDLKSSFARAGKLEDAVLVSEELKTIAATTAGDSPEELGGLLAGSDLPRSKRQLEKYLINTDWAVKDKDGRQSHLKFRDKGRIHMPWHECTWRSADTRLAIMNNASDWSFRIH